MKKRAVNKFGEAIVEYTAPNDDYSADVGDVVMWVYNAGGSPPESLLLDKEAAGWLIEVLKEFVARAPA